MYDAKFDVIVLGLGGMGSAAAAHLASRGKRVLGLEQFYAVHNLGSSHGNTRIIRQAYFEDPAYVPLLLRTYELWEQLQSQSSEQLYRRTGGLMVGRADGPLVSGSLRSAREHNLAYEMLDASELRRRFPVTRPRSDDVALFELPAGMLFPEACTRAHLQLAARAGAQLRFNTPVQSWKASSTGAVCVTTQNGEAFEAEQLVICAGAWLDQVAADLDLALRVERNVMHWFEPDRKEDAAALAELPIYIVDRESERALYGFPYIEGQGLKAAFHHTGEYTKPQALNRTVTGEEVASLRGALAEWIPAAAGQCINSVVCMYTLTPDEHFIVDVHPKFPNVIIAGGFSGHGFKFCAVMGEVIADLALQGSTRHPIQLFSVQRLLGAKR